MAARVLAGGQGGSFLTVLEMDVEMDVELGGRQSYWDRMGLLLNWDEEGRVLRGYKSSCSVSSKGLGMYVMARKHFTASGLNSVLQARYPMEAKHWMHHRLFAAFWTLKAASSTDDQGNSHNGSVFRKKKVDLGLSRTRL